MYTITFENIRGFAKKHEITIKPITLLVGENSSGKTTLLSLVRLAWHVVHVESISTDGIFNEEPFLLGSSTQIATRHSRSQAKHFQIGQQFEIPLKFPSEILSSTINIYAEYGINASKKFVFNKWVLTCGLFTIVATQEQEIFARSSLFSVTVSIGNQQLGITNVFPLLHGRWIDIVVTLLSRDQNLQQSETSILLSQLDINNLVNIHHQINRLSDKKPYAPAPIRSKPKRTYDPINYDFNPDGTHIPMVLVRELSSDSDNGKRLREALQKFGKASGLFTAIEVDRKGKLESDPFQINVKIGGTNVNLVDVGYGVSQVLPIIVDLIQSSQGSTHLLQQPEVHLHPKAQAELGSFLAHLAIDQHKHIIIETHGDYLVDRIRMEVREQRINSNDVTILYFENQSTGTHIYPLSLDDNGNITNAPANYRKFFLDEVRRQLGI